MANIVKNTCVTTEYLVLGMLENNIYIISEGGTTIVVDPTCKADKIIEALKGRTLDYLILTHHHFDHMGAAKELVDKTGATVIASVEDAPLIAGEKKLPDYERDFVPCPVDRRVSHGDVLTLGKLSWKVLRTPGHTPGSICLFLDAEKTDNPAAASVLISGDTLFYGSIGRTDFAGGSMSDMRQSLKKLATLPDDTVVLPGHGELTTIGAERKRVFAYYA